MNMKRIMKMRVAKISEYDTANGPGIRITLWVQGCEHYCKECHNQSTWDLNGGREITDKALHEIYEFLSNPYVAGITFSGGDPLHPQNRDGVFEIAEYVKEHFPGKTVWCYTGYSYEEVCDLQVMKYIDVLVDGEFHIDERDLTLKFRGSRNQRLIDVQKSRNSSNIVLKEV